MASIAAVIAARNPVSFAVIAILGWMQKVSVSRMESARITVPGLPEGDRFSARFSGCYTY